MEATAQPTKLTKIKEYATVIFDRLSTKQHRKSELAFQVTKSDIRNGVYDFCPRIQTGFISTKAYAAIQSGLKRHKLCHEHFITRNETAVDVINTYEYHSSNGAARDFIVDKICAIFAKGSQVNLVLSEENHELAKYQKLDLEPAAAYQMAGVTLMKEPVKKYRHAGKTYGTQKEIARDLKVSATTVQKYLKRGIVTEVYE